MRLAVIDLGTNTFHLLIVKLKGNGFSVLHKEKIPVRIGKDGISKGLITEEAKGRALITITHFKNIISGFKVDKTFATATSAIRNAINGKEVTQEIIEKTGIQIQIISGIQEAEYIATGVRKALDIGEKPALIMDIGGGSIEFIIATNNENLWSHSFEIGGQRLIDQFHKEDPISADQQGKLINHLQSKLEILKKTVQNYEIDTLIGSSGTFDTLSDIYRNKYQLVIDDQSTEFPFDFSYFHELAEMLISSDKKSRLKIPGMIAMRVEMISVAVLLVKYVVEELEIRNLRISAYALKEGVLLSTIDKEIESSR